MKFELLRPRDLSDKAIINEIQRVSHLIKPPLTKKKFKTYSKFSTSTIEKRFKGWIKALELCGLDEKYLTKSNIKLKKQDILEELIKVSKLIGKKSFTQKHFLIHSKYSNPGIFSKNDWSFKSLMKEAKLIVPKISKKYCDDERFENLLKVWTFYGRQPKYSEMQMNPSTISGRSYVSRWGTWLKSLEAFINFTSVTNEINGELLDIENLSKPNEVKIEKPKIQRDKVRDVPVGLRFKVFKRDNYRCIICGRSPATHTEIKELQADHILAWSKGGQTILENLQTLCNDCNLGKSAKDM